MGKMSPGEREVLYLSPRQCVVLYFEPGKEEEEMNFTKSIP